MCRNFQTPKFIKFICFHSFVISFVINFVRPSNQNDMARKKNKKTLILLWSNSLCLQNKLKNKHVKPLLIPPFTPTPLFPHPCSSLRALLIFDLCSSTGTAPAVSSPRAEVLRAAIGAVRDGIFDDRFTARPGWAVWLLPGVCWSWWQRKGRRERYWSACSHSRLLVRQTASRDRRASDRCPDRMPPPSRRNNVIFTFMAILKIFRS